MRFSRLPRSGAGASWCGVMSYGEIVLYPAPSVVTAHTIVPDSSSSSAEEFGPRLYVSAPGRPFTRTTCVGGWYGCGAYAGGPARYGLLNG